MSEYMTEWIKATEAVKEAADWHCEHCGHEHDPGHGYRLQTHFLDGNKDNVDPTNLVALCQRCRLRIQYLYKPGQMSLPGYSLPWMERRGL